LAGRVLGGNFPRLVPRSRVSGCSPAQTLTYDGDGNRVKSVIGGTTTYFVGNYYEASGSAVTKYYYAGSQRVAMRTGSSVYYLLCDQLGSTTITTNAQGGLVSELRYDACPLRSATGVLREGVVRYTSGTQKTKYQYTGQYAETTLGLDFFQARYYDPAIGRFISADSIVPPGVQGYDRYAYANNSPVVYSDPTGHASCFGDRADDGPQCKNRDSMLKGGYRSITVGAPTGGARQSLGESAEDSYTNTSLSPQ
jgi:RHS repeat-associated protein